MSNGPSSITDVQAKLNFGVWLQPAVLSPDWADLEAKIVSMINDRVSAIPWLPAGWFAGVEALRKEFPTWRILVAPPISTNGARLPDAPPWLDTEEKLKAWNDVASAIKDAVNLYSIGRIEDGKAALDDLYANAAFWTAAHKTVKFIADAPGVVIAAAGDFASGIAGTFLKSFWPVLVLGAIAGVIYFNREKLFTAAGERAAGIIKG